MKKILSLLMMAVIATQILAQQQPQQQPPQQAQQQQPPQQRQQMKPEETEDWSRRPAIITPGKFGAPPSDAIVLYGGPQDAVNWVHENGNAPIRWEADSVLTVVPRTGGIKTTRSFGNCQLHVEWRTPSVVTGTSQGRGNSGVFLMGLYELQVLDSYDNETYYNGQAGSIYKQFIPLVNASLGPGEWQTFDIVFTAPIFQTNGELLKPAFFTVFHNGVLIQNNVALRGPTEYIGIPAYKAHENKLPISLQEHGNPVSFRNIWIRELE
ncbi:MAG TPA: DUF1080 domain-containing protein [Bacteroidales bacterium]|jgi:hypothetical protein|nr:DUF1080 domain-containing protein [Bacteroidales bacterium]